MVITREALTTWAEENDIELVLLDPPEHFDHAIVGLVRGSGQELAVLYDEEKVIQAMRAEGAPKEDAEDFFETNTIGAWMGDATPRFLIRPWEPSEEEEEEEPDVTET